MFTKKEINSDIEIFTVYDSKVESYDFPIFAQSKAALIRDILNIFGDPQQKNNKHLVNAEDFSVFKIGSYSKKEGKLHTHQPEHVVNLHELRSASRPILNETPSQVGMIST